MVTSPLVGIQVFEDKLRISASCTNDPIVGRGPLLHLMGVLMILEWFVYIALLHSLPDLSYSPLLQFVEGGSSVEF